MRPERKGKFVFVIVNGTFISLAGLATPHTLCVNVASYSSGCTIIAVVGKEMIHGLRAWLTRTPLAITYGHQKHATAWTPAAGVACGAGPVVADKVVF